MGFKKDYQEITLPDSGEKITTRHLKALDYNYIGAVPDTFIETWRKLTGKKNVSLRDLDGANSDFIVRIAMRGIVKQSGEFELVAKHPPECDEKEISFFDLAEKDQAAILGSIFSGGEGIPLDFLETLSGTGGQDTQGKDEKQA